MVNIFAHVHDLFDALDGFGPNGSINVYLSQLFVWTTADGYITADQLQARVNQFSSIRSSFNGDIAQLLHWSHDRHSSGIAASVGGGICGSGSNHSIANLFTPDPGGSSINNPVSYMSLIMAHEMAHTLGACHTECCAFFGSNSAIESDGCGANCGNSGCNNTNGTFIGRLNPSIVMSYNWSCGTPANSIDVDATSPFHPQNATKMCNCIGNFGTPPHGNYAQDMDNDGINNVDECPGQDFTPNPSATFPSKNGNISGCMCDDANPCTHSDIFENCENGDCNCQGQPLNFQSCLSCRLHDFSNNPISPYNYIAYPHMATGYGGAILNWHSSTSNVNCSPDIGEDINGNQYIRLISQINPQNGNLDYYEGFLVQLCNPFLPGTEMNIQLDYAFYHDQSLNSCNDPNNCGSLLVQGSTNSPSFTARLPRSNEVHPFAYSGDQIQLLQKFDLANRGNRNL